MKKLLAILLICALYTPDVTRLVMYAQCASQANDSQQCDCNYSSAPSDQQANFPEKQKEIQQQTDWKYIIAEKQFCLPSLLNNTKRYSGYNNSTYSFSFLSSIFHPPCSSDNIL